MQTNQNIDTSNNKSLIVGPDYGHLIGLHTNGAIVEAFISLLFSKNTKFDLKTIMLMIRNMVILVVVKMVLEDSKTYLDKFKFTNLNFFKYGYQYMKFSEVKYDLVQVCNKWMYKNNYIAINTLTNFLEQKSIFISQPSVYYYNEGRYLIKTIISTHKITFAIPNVSSIIRYMDDLLHKNQEIVFGGKTIISKIIITQSNVIRIEPVHSAYAFPTENYLKLEESIKNYFLVDTILNTSSSPYCVNFDGPPGTGKTTFGNYIALSGIFDRIFICNLVQASNINFQELVTNLDRQISNTSNKKIDCEFNYILIIFDEIDKWLESYISNQIHKLRDEARTKKQISGEKNIETESHDKLSQSEENDKKMQIRMEFLDQLYKLLEGQILPDTRKYVLIFNTNNFNEIFLNVDKRFDALLDRFDKFKFDLIGKEDIIIHIENLSKKLENHEFDNMDKNKKLLCKETINRLCQYDKNIFDQIPESIRISYRTLHKILKRNSYKIDKMIKELYHYDNLII